MKLIDPGNAAFDDLIQNNNLYVDKTSYMYKLITDGVKFHFLSRPRRFGKSLTISTLEAIFKAKRELFKGLYIDSADYEWKEYPMIRINFSSITYLNNDDFIRKIKNEVCRIAKRYGVDIPLDYSYDDSLNLLIEELSEREKVVILIDEYDAPLTNNINSDNIEDIRSILRGFYSVIKAQDGNIRFCFITGVTKFSKMSIFSAMNNLIDISLSDEYATMFGYTEKELEDNFSEYIELGMKNIERNRDEYLSLIKKWYDGYSFSPRGEKVYNPVSIGCFFRDGGDEFSPYWIDTGGMSYLLIEIAKRVKFDITKDIEIKMPKEALQSVDIIQMARTEINKDNFLSLLYQTGYLTIKEAKKLGGSYLFTLGYPNEEVKRGLSGILLPLYLGKNTSPYRSIRILNFFEEGKVDEALEEMKAIYASIPYNELVYDRESAWHASFLSMMKIIGADIIGGVSTSMGWIDAVLTCPDDIYIIEFKYDKSTDNRTDKEEEILRTVSDNG